MDFLQDARTIECLVLRFCKNSIPKSYTLLISVNLVNTARQIYSHAKIGNSIYATNSHEQQMRIDEFQLARASCYDLISEIELVNEFLPKEKKRIRRIERLSELLHKEIGNLKGQIERERKILKGL